MRTVAILLVLVALGWAASPGEGRASVADEDAGAFAWKIEARAPSDAQMCDWILRSLGGGPCPR